MRSRFDDRKNNSLFPNETENRMGEAIPTNNGQGKREKPKWEISGLRGNEISNPTKKHWLSDVDNFFLSGGVAHSYGEVGLLIRTQGQEYELLGKGVQ